MNQRKLDHEVKTLQVQAAQFAKQTGQWIGMVENFNQALKVGHTPTSLPFSEPPLAVFSLITAAAADLRLMTKRGWPQRRLLVSGKLERKKAGSRDARCGSVTCLGPWVQSLAPQKTLSRVHRSVVPAALEAEGGRGRTAGAQGLKPA